jgi:hypothetical protein
VDAQSGCYEVRYKKVKVFFPAHSLSWNCASSDGTVVKALDHHMAASSL